MKTSDAQPILAAYSYLQHGLVTSAQASAAGIDTTTLARLAQKDFLRRIRRGVYILSSVAETPDTEVRAAWLSTEPARLAEERLGEVLPTVVSHVSAASLLGLGDIVSAEHTFTTAIRKQSSAPDIRHRTADLPASDRMIINGIPVTTPLRTIHDLAKDHLDGDQLHHVIADAIHDRKLKASAIGTMLNPVAHHYGVKSGDALVSAALARFPESETTTEARRYQYGLPSINMAGVADPAQLLDPFTAASLLGEEYVNKSEAFREMMQEAFDPIPFSQQEANVSAVARAIQEALQPSQLESQYAAINDIYDHRQTPTSFASFPRSSTSGPPEALSTTEADALARQLKRVLIDHLNGVNFQTDSSPGPQRKDDT